MRSPSRRAPRPVLAVLLSLAACSDSPSAPHSDRPPPVVRPGVPSLITVPTYEGSGQAVHPDVVVFDQPWRGATHWMAVTPYPFGNAYHENPSVLAGDDGLRWATPDGGPDPVIPAPPSGYNSDPDLVYDAAHDRLVLLWREVSARNVIRATASSDGRSWSPPVVVTSAPNHRALSPAVVIRDGRPLLWYVDAGGAGCTADRSVLKLRRGESMSALLPSAPDAGWSPEIAASLTIPGQVVWHLDVAHLARRAELWAVVHAFPPSVGCGAGDLYLARSRDGVTWTAEPEPFLRAADQEWSRASLYRTSLVPDEERGVLRLWISARSGTGRWSVGYMELELADPPPLA